MSIYLRSTFDGSRRQRAQRHPQRSSLGGSHALDQAAELPRQLSSFSIIGIAFIFTFEFILLLSPVLCFLHLNSLRSHSACNFSTYLIQHELSLRYQWRSLCRHGGQGLRCNCMRPPTGHAGLDRLQQLPQDLQLRSLNLPRVDWPGHGRQHCLRPPSLQGEYVPTPRRTEHCATDFGQPGQFIAV